MGNGTAFLNQAQQPAINWISSLKIVETKDHPSNKILFDQILICFWPLRMKH
jgi:hypothetical protein